MKFKTLGEVTPPRYRPRMLVNRLTNGKNRPYVITSVQMSNVLSGAKNEYCWTYAGKLEDSGVTVMSTEDMLGSVIIEAMEAEFAQS